MAVWAHDANFSRQLNLLMVCMEVGRSGLSTAQHFGRQFRLPAAVKNGFIEHRSELPRFGQLGCQGFIVLGPYGEFAVQRTVPCYLEVGQAAFGAVENLLASLWGLRRTERVTLAGARESSQMAWPSVGVPEMDEEHGALEKALALLQASPHLDALVALAELWQSHSQHEEELFEKFDFGQHRSAAQGQAATAPHCEHHRRIARMMETAKQACSCTAGNLLPTEFVATLIGEINRHAEVYDAAYAGKLAVQQEACVSS